MSSSKALASLTASYTDSENEDGDNKEETSMDIESDEEEQPEEEPKIEVEYNDDGLPPEPTNPCPKDLQDKITKLYDQMQNGGLDMNDVIQNRKAFRNPSIYEKLIDFCNLNEFGTNYPAEIYDPLKWGKESYYDELAKVQKAEMEKREKERKEKTKVTYVVFLCYFFLLLSLFLFQCVAFYSSIDTVRILHDYMSFFFPFCRLKLSQEQLKKPRRPTVAYLVQYYHLQMEKNAVKRNGIKWILLVTLEVHFYTDNSSHL